MAGGSLSLTGNTQGQDVLSFNPQITFFKKVYKRHTNFGIETSRQNNITGNLDFGSTNEIRIEKKGSLITDMHFEFSLPPAAGDGGIENEDVDEKVTIAQPLNNTGCVDNFHSYARWVNGVGFAIINEIKLKFGSTTVDTHTGLWFDVWNELTDPNRKEWSLVGKYEQQSRIGKSDLDNSRYYIPLKFYFNKNPGLAIPIFLLNENELKINISLNSLNSLLTFNTLKNTPATPTTIRAGRAISNFKFYATYVFLEQYEESRISSSLPSEYIAETLDIHRNLTSSTGVSALVFENPTKEIIWVFRHPDRIVTGDITNVPEEFESAEISDIFPNDIFNYSRHGKNGSLGYGTYDPFTSVKMTIDSKDRFETTEATYFRTIQPYKYHSNVPGGISKELQKQYIYVYSFSLKPEDYQPSGSYNFSLNDDRVGFQFSGPDAVVGTKGMSEYDLTVFAVRYEYIKFDISGRVSVASLPKQSVFEDVKQTAVATAAREAESAGGDEAAVAAAVATARDDIRKAGKSSRAGVSKEIKRRYAVEVPYTRDQSLGKKKWSGLQGDFFQTQKDEELGKDRQIKKKDIF
jgi:hypothetical protein